MALPYITSTHNYTEKPNLKMFNMHNHDDYEIYCFLKGSAEYYVEGNVYSLNSGDILLMKRAEAHSLIVNKLSPYERIVINFNREALSGEIAPEIIAFLENRPLGKQNKYSAKKTKNIVGFLNKICKSDNFSEKQLYLTFVLNELKNSTPSDDDTVNTVQDIIGYINENLFEDISLDSVAEQFFMSKNHLNRQFKKYTGSTIWSYIVIKRLIYAKSLLTAGEKPTAVCKKCGFNDYCSFYRAYKQKYGISPNEVKKQSE